MKRLAFFGLFLFYCSFAVATSGVSPASHFLEFAPNYSESFEFEFVFDDEESRKVFIEGEMGQYAKVDRKSVKSGDRVEVFLNLPNNISDPGVHTIGINAGGVVGVIKLSIPYPGQYLELEISAPNINKGDDMNVNFRQYNYGYRDLYVKPTVYIYQGDKMIDYIVGEESYISASSFLNEDYVFENFSWPPGNYFAGGTAEYSEERIRKDHTDKRIGVDNSFRVGEKKVRIINYTNMFNQNDFPKFEVYVESLWNSRVDNFYVELKNLNNGDILLSSPVVHLNAWEKRNIVAFFDSVKVNNEDFVGEVIVYFDGEMVSQEIYMGAIERINYVFVTVYIFSCIIFLFLLWRLVLFLEALG